VPSGHGIEGEEMILDCHQTGRGASYRPVLGVGRIQQPRRVANRSEGKFSGGSF